MSWFKRRPKPETKTLAEIGMAYIDAHPWPKTPKPNPRLKPKRRG